MSDDKKSDDYRVDMPSGKEFRAASPPTRSAGSNRAGGVAITENPIAAVLAYCGSSIMMTVTNKYVLSGVDFNLNFFLLCVQSVVCVAAISICKALGIINYRDFNSDEAKKWFPISVLLIGMIYTSTWALKYLSIPVYTIFKNLTIILIAYGEVLWFGGAVTPMALFSFGLMVLSSVIAAWADIQHALSSMGHAAEKTTEAMSTLHAGYLWMMFNCFCSATYVLCMRKRIKLTNFKDFDTMYYNNLLTIPILLVASILVEDWSSANVAKNFPVEQRNTVIMVMIISGLSTVFISYTSAWAVRVTSSTTYSMVGALNKLPIALSGLVFFDAPVTFGSCSAIFVGFVSGLVYALAKVRQNSKPKTVLPTTNIPLSASSRSMQDSLKS
ncbi:GDP-mannose transporter into the lumen of the Golgi [Alternaria hordeiaustralica]|uniref:GDP-mannose transporter into the lumen of the Golgi n=1 Tax=Alternaria hordeiaustralica TaxID=1187925 RepID=UPI0020C33C01|nr:GDP-mannose transporter into the lumen of the Golgi [Alternaria hordeiaustralica]KAI4686414.1 GDP-mannose transporter into the lumen of the Golgi [Alternaria hordeiaustralica]